MDASARAIIRNKDKILLIYRNKNGKEYFVVPGGTMETKETPELTAVREVYEETNLAIKIGAKLWEINNSHLGKDKLQIFFEASEYSGELKLGGEELQRQTKDNTYDLEWIYIKDLDKITLYPEGLAEKIMKKYQKKKRFSFFK